MFEFDPDIKRSLRRKTTKHETRVELLEDYIKRVSALDHVWVWSAVLGDRKLDDCIRSSAGYQLGQLATHDAIRALRLVLHDRSESYDMRLRALRSLQFADELTFSIDVRAILGDPSESNALRAEAAEKIYDESCLPLLKALLSQDNLDAEIAFWCIYACASLGCEDPEVDEILARYTEDHRPVDPKMGSHQKQPATVSMEAVWALRQRRQDYCEPQWAIEPEGSEQEFRSN